MYKARPKECAKRLHGISNLEYVRISYTYNYVRRTDVLEVKFYDCVIMGLIHGRYSILLNDDLDSIKMKSFLFG